MKEWYLMTPNTRPNVTSGYENDAFLDYRDDAFVETLETNIATTVILYSSDLSTQKQIRCIIQGNTADSQIKSMERVGLFQRGNVRAGMYILFENCYWLISGYPGTNGIYEKAVMVLCQYKLRWQNTLGEIIERWCNSISASKYDIGENGNNTIRLSSSTFSILVPDDKETLELDGKRVFIDKHLTNPTKVFKITRNDDILSDYGKDHGCVLGFIADKTEYNSITDNQLLRICDYKEPTLSPPPLLPDDETTDLTAIISGGDTLRCGRAKSWTVSFKDKSGNIVEHNSFYWNVISNFTISQTVSDHKIQIKTDDETLIGESFILQVIAGEVMADCKITITEGF